MQPRENHKISDTAQQVVGGFLLAGPFVVTQEVWMLALNMSIAHSLFIVGIIIAIGYGGLYGANTDRDPSQEAAVVGVPIRFLSVMIVAFGSVTVLAFAVTAPDLFLGDLHPTERLYVTFRAISVGSIFSVVGAVTTDSIF